MTTDRLGELRLESIENKVKRGLFIAARDARVLLGALREAREERDDAQEFMDPTWQERAVAAESECAALRGRAEVAKGLLREAVETENYPCRLDHHGYCQDHPWGMRDGGCWIVAARALLVVWDTPTDTTRETP